MRNSASLFIANAIFPGSLFGFERQISLEQVDPAPERLILLPHLAGVLYRLPLTVLLLTPCTQSTLIGSVADPNPNFFPDPYRYRYLNKNYFGSATLPIGLRKFL
jgi:hypothetical protein